MQERARGRAGRVVLGALAASAVLVACSSSVSLRQPAPVVIRSPHPVAAAPVPAAPTPMAPESAASEPVAVAVPVPSTGLPAATPVAEPPPTPARPASPAVAARFPEPDVTFATPAFAPGRTDFTSNGELHELLGAVARNGAASPATSVELLALGESGWGTPIEAVAFTRAPAPPTAPVTASSASAPSTTLEPPRRPVVVLVGGQHGDEPAATEALIVIVQGLAAGRFERVLDRVDVVVLPRANPDGADALQHVLASGIDLDRDHLLLRSPEARAEASLMTRFEPLVVADLHEYVVDGRFEDKFGGVPRPDVLLDYATTANVAPFITKAAEEWFREPLEKGLASAGYSTDWYHTTSADPADRRVAMGGTESGIGRNTDGLRNAVSLFVASRGAGFGRTDLRRRVQAQVLSVSNILASAARRAGDLVKLRQFVERDIASRACQGEAVIVAAPTPSEYGLRLLDPQTGAVKRVTVAWESSLQLRVLKSRPRPCGYWLAASEVEAAARLQALGIVVQQFEEGGELRGQTYRESGAMPVPDAAGPASGPAAGLKVETQPTLLDVPAGSYYVSLEQPLANLAIAALEPEAPGSYPAERIVPSLDGVARVLARPAMRLIDAR